MYDSRQTSVSEEQIREEMSLLLMSKAFQQSNRLARFLKFTVEHALDGKSEDLKEYTIGVEVYDRGTSFSPSLDSIVRGEARRLRSKLKEYYEGEGRDRPIIIYYRLGSYAPLFQPNEFHASASSSSAPCDIFPIGDPKPVIAVVPFQDLSNMSASLALASGITDELIHLLTTIGSYRVVAPGKFAHSLAQGIDPHVVGASMGAKVLLEGRVKQEKTHVRITSSLVDGEGFQLGSYRFEADGDAEQLFVVQETIASDLVDELSRFLGKQHGPHGSKFSSGFPNISAHENRSTLGIAKSSSRSLKVVGANHSVPTRESE